MREATGQIVNFTGRSGQTPDEASLALALFAGLPDGLLVTDLHGKIVSANEAFCQLSGYEAGQLVGQPASILNSGYHTAEFFQEMWDSLRCAGHWRGELWNRKRSGELFLSRVTMMGMGGGEGGHRFFGALFSPPQGQTDEDLRSLTAVDPLTGLTNRTGVSERLSVILEEAGRNGSTTALLHLDINNLKIVNDTLGHAVGDEVLCILANRITAIQAGGELVARISGDEFAVVLEGLDEAEVAAVASRMLQAVSQPLTVAGEEVFLTASLGIGMAPADSGDAAGLFRCASSALSRAKEQGRNSYRFYRSQMDERSRLRMQTQSALRHALENHEFELYYQPKVDLRSLEVRGMEALIRWIHPEKGLIPPDRFIGEAEETGLIVPIGSWALETACRQNREWLDQGLPPMRVAVNLSCGQFSDRQALVDGIADVLCRTGLPPELLELEITESVAMENTDAAIETLQQIASLGVTLSIDDFGTGYSSLSYLKKLPIDMLKIDKSFIRDVGRDNADMTIAATIISMAHSLQRGVVAEGIETIEQLKLLQACGCDEGQGYYFSRPLPAAVFPVYCRNSLDMGQPIARPAE